MSHLMSRISAYDTEGQIKDRPLPHRYGQSVVSPAGCLPAVTAPDGYGMILIESRVDLENATYRVICRDRVFDGLRA
jgi:hypothetical protein